MAGIMAINTNIEDTKNIIWNEDRNLFAIVSLWLDISEFRGSLEVLTLPVAMVVLVFLKSIIISFTYSDGNILVIIKNDLDYIEPIINEAITTAGPPRCFWPRPLNCGCGPERKEEAAFTWDKGSASGAGAMNQHSARAASVARQVVASGCCRTGRIWGR